MFRGEPGKVERGAIGASESGHGNGCEDDKRDPRLLGRFG